MSTPDKREDLANPLELIRTTFLNGDFLYFLYNTNFEIKLSSL